MLGVRKHFLRTIWKKFCAQYVACGMFELDACGCLLVEFSILIVIIPGAFGHYVFNLSTLCPSFQTNLNLLIYKSNFVALFWAISLQKSGYRFQKIDNILSTSSLQYVGSLLLLGWIILVVARFSIHVVTLE